MSKPRKQHAAQSGYISERMNPFVRGTKVVIYLASEQDIDADGCKYAVVCHAHGSIVGTTSIPKAREIFVQPDSFCDDCRELASFGKETA